MEKEILRALCGESLEPGLTRRFGAPYNRPVPIYEYRCKKCGHIFEKMQRFSDEPVRKCPQCGGAVEQLLSAPAVQFKGSGWYVTDYAKKSTAPHAKGESKGETKAETKSETKSDTKHGESKKPKSSAKD